MQLNGAQALHGLADPDSAPRPDEEHRHQRCVSQFQATNPTKVANAHSWSQLSSVSSGLADFGDAGPRVVSNELEVHRLTYCVRRYTRQELCGRFKSPGLCIHNDTEPPEAESAMIVWVMPLNVSQTARNLLKAVTPAEQHCRPPPMSFGRRLSGIPRHVHLFRDPRSYQITRRSVTSMYKICGVCLPPSMDLSAQQISSLSTTGRPRQAVKFYMLSPYCWSGDSRASNGDGRATSADPIAHTYHISNFFNNENPRRKKLNHGTGHACSAVPICRALGPTTIQELWLIAGRHAPGKHNDASARGRSG
ncbi:hypothetical protein GE09DRAFT_181870 [Coniochaeta sp. 2T2.1]|nr:hypothetical protein GE09DRAFT_181870 [Coniochaeta sp. 2T2.1]